MELMLQDSKEKFRKLEYLKNKIIKFNSSVTIDDEDDLHRLLSLEETIKNFKKLLRTIV